MFVDYKVKSAARRLASKVIQMPRKKERRDHFDPTGQKNARLLTSHRYNHLPLLPSGPGGVQQELAV